MPVVQNEPQNIAVNSFEIPPIEKSLGLAASVNVILSRVHPTGYSFTCQERIRFQPTVFPSIGIGLPSLILFIQIFIQDESTP